MTPNPGEYVRSKRFSKSSLRCTYFISDRLLNIAEAQGKRGRAGKFNDPWPHSSRLRKKVVSVRILDGASARYGRLYDRTNGRLRERTGQEQ